MSSRTGAIWTLTTGMTLIGLMAVAGTKPVLASWPREFAAWTAWFLTLMFAIFLGEMWVRAGQLPVIDVIEREHLS